MRISTQAYFANAIAGMLEQQSTLSKVQNQVSTGRRVNTPADDPIAAVHILELERAAAESDQYGKNTDIVRSRLNLEEQALADVGSLLQRVREIAVSGANTATLSDNDRRSLAVELQGRLEELQGIANRRDSNGEYMFSGFSTLTQPFVRTGGAVAYVGDQGNRLVQVDSTQKIADGHSGGYTFMDITEGNGTFTTAATGTNTGNANIDAGSVVNTGAWVPDDYTLTFTTAAAWEVRDGLNNLVTSGAYTPGGSIAFNGVQVTVAGTPAAGDSFSIDQAGSEDIFTTMQDIITALNAPASTPAARARLSTAMANSLEQIDTTTDHFLGVRAEVGARLSALDEVENAREVHKIDLQSSLSDLRDLDYAEALARMNQQIVGLQAAQLSYSQISQLSLFNYLR